MPDADAVAFDRLARPLLELIQRTTGLETTFKAVNDTYGHDGGDQVLVAAAEVLREAARLEDVPARIGGDEFALLLPECLEVGAKQVAARVSENFVRITESLDMACSLSIGVSSTETTPAHRLLAAADEALYRSKATESPATTLAVSL